MNNLVYLNHLLRIERKKLFPYRAFNVMLTLYAGLFVLCTIAFSDQIFNSIWELIPDSVQGNFRTNIAWNAIAYFAGFFNVFLSYAVILYTCNEYGYRTWRQSFIDGLQRREALLGKLLMIGLLTLATTLLVALMGVYQELNMPHRASFPLGLPYMGLYALQLFSTLVMAFFFAVWLRKTGLAILLFGAWWYLLDGFLLYYAILPADVAVFLPASNLKDLVHIPGMDELLAQEPTGTLAGTQEALNGFAKLMFRPSYLRGVLVASGYNVLFIFLCYRLLQRRDI